MTSAHRIPAGNREWLETRLAKAVKKAEKLGVPVPVWEYSTLVTTTKKKAGSPDTIEHWYDVTITADPVYVDGWQLVGIIDHAATAEGVIIRLVPGESVPESYRTAANTCDHCKTARQRLETFVLEREGIHQQVGRNCLADFLRMDPADIVSAATWHKDLADIWEEAEGTAKAAHAMRYTVGYLEVVAAVMREYGWVSRAMVHAGEVRFGQQATANVAATANTKDGITVTVTDADRELARAAYRWGQELGSDITQTLTEYAHTVTQLLRESYFDTKYLGVVGSVVHAYKRNLERQQERAARDRFAAETAGSDHFGEIKQRGEYVFVMQTVRELDGEYGTTYLHTFSTPDGNVVKWFGSKLIEAEMGEEIRVKATIKKHDEYQGVKQTIVNRVTRIEAGGMA